MATEIKGEMCTCACGAAGWIVQRSNPLAPFEWFEVHHESQAPHFMRTVRRDDGAFRFELLDEGDWQ